MGSLRVILADLKHYNKYSYYEYYVPLPLGYLVSHVKKVYGDAVDASIYVDPHRFLKAVIDQKPHVIGFSLYAWNLYLIKTMIGIIREKLGDEVVIVVGGPTIDTDKGEQLRLFSRFPGVDAMIPGEGEIAFGNLIGAMLSKKDIRKSAPVDGIVFFRDNTLIAGNNLGMTIDLAEVKSPYVSGILDEFLRPPFRPQIQTNRGCPFTCTFCVSGKNPRKLRKFPLEYIRDDLHYLARFYSKIPHNFLDIVDDNFGLFKSDIEVAECIAKTSKDLDFPLAVGFYNDKRLTDISKEVALRMKDLQAVFCVSLQTDSPDALNAVKRINHPKVKLREAVSWVRSNNLKSMTELIFGLPHETKESFTNLLENTVNSGFDLIQTNPLLLLDGAEINRQKSRDEFGFKTKFRLFMNNYGYIDNRFTAEAEEVAVSSQSFSFDDFISIRYQTFMFYSVFINCCHYLFFQELRLNGIKITDFIDAFFNPEKSEEWPAGYLKFLSDLKHVVIDELYDSKEDLYKAIEVKYIKNNCQVLTPTKVNILYSSRLIFQEKDWCSEVFRRILERFDHKIDLPKLRPVFDFLLKLYEQQLINPREPGNYPPTLQAYYDVISWKRDQFTKSLIEYKLDQPQTIHFSLDPYEEKRFLSFAKENNEVKGMDYYYAFVDLFRSDLLYSFEYKEPALAEMAQI